jgi:hypothetical protein
LEQQLAQQKRELEQQLEQRLVLQRREFERQLELQKRAQLFIPSTSTKLSAKKEDSFNDEEPSSTSTNDEYSSNDEEPSSSSDIEELIPAPQIEDTPPLEPSSTNKGAEHLLPYLSPSPEGIHIEYFYDEYLPDVFNFMNDVLATNDQTIDLKGWCVNEARGKEYENVKLCGKLFLWTVVALSVQLDTYLRVLLSVKFSISAAMVLALN